MIGYASLPYSLRCAQRLLRCYGRRRSNRLEGRPWGEWETPGVACTRTGVNSFRISHLDWGPQLIVSEVLKARVLIR